MSRIYDSWEKLVGAVLRREEDRQLALCESFSSSSSADLSSRFSFSFNPFVGDIHVPPGVSKQKIFYSRDLMGIDYKEIEKATKNFHPDMLLSEGGFGRVYRGCGTAVAFKKMNDEESQGDEEWRGEINYLSQLRHPNLAKLIGYSFGTDDRIVVYELMAGGSLDHHLFKRHQSLPWATRIKVAIGAARALAFLRDLEIPAIHRDFKSGAILLDYDLNTKLSDFGLARDGPTGDRTHISTRVMGAYGYAAPEYWTTGRLTTRSDVFGFGVVLLELISGLRVFHSMRSEGRHNMLDWAKPHLRDKRNLSRFMDSRLEGQYPHGQAYEVGQIALRCVSSYSRSRPMMSVIVADLEKLYILDASHRINDSFNF